MNSFTSRQRYFLYRGPTDMRKSFDGLSGLVNAHMSRGLLSGDVFIFINRRRDRMKLLVWEDSGFVIWYKRLEEGTFELPLSSGSGAEIELKWEDLMLIVSGIKLASVKRRKRYAHRQRNAQNVEKSIVLGG